MIAHVDNTDPLLEVFVDTFLGYGSFRAPLWFVGPVATPLTSEADDPGRTILSWHRRGHRELEDLCDFHAAGGVSAWFGPRPRLHRIWGKLSRLALAYADRTTAHRDVRHYQATRLGARNGQTCMLYLYPIAPSADTRVRGMDESADWRRASADTRWAARRQNLIRRKIQKHSPDVVVFYDVSHRDTWQVIADGVFAPSELPQCLHCAGGDTTYLMLRHPESIGITNEYFERAGRLAAGRSHR